MRNAAPERGTRDSVPYLFSILFRSNYLSLLDLDQHRCREADLCASNDSEGTNFAWRKLAASFLCAAPILLHVSPAKTVPPLAEPAITSNTALSLLLGGGDGDAQLPRAKHDLTHMKDNAATSKPTIVVIDGGPAIRDLIEFLLLRTVGYHVTGLIK
jgi:hypothetical protein